MMLRLLSSLVLLLLFTVGSDASPLILDDTLDKQALRPHMALWHNPEGHASLINVVKGQHEVQFTNIKRDHIDVSSGEYWYRFSVHNPSDKPASRYLVLSTVLILDLTVGYLVDNELVQHSTGLQHPRSKWPSDYRFPAFKIQFPPGTTTLYLSTLPNTGIAFLPQLYTPEGLVRLTQHDNLFSISIVGFCSGIAIYILLLAATMGEWRSIGWYLGIIFTNIFIILHLSGTSIAWLGDQVYWQERAASMISGITGACNAQFARSLFQTKNCYPKIDKLLILLTLSGLLIVVFFVVLDLADAITFNNISAMFTLPVFIVFVDLLAKQRRRLRNVLFFRHERLVDDDHGICLIGIWCPTP